MAITRRSRARLTAATICAASLAFIYRPIFEGKALAGRDLFRMFIPDASYLRDSLLAGELPLWSPYSLLGHPFLGGLQSQVLYPLRVIPVLLLGAPWGITFEHLAHMAIAFFGTRLAARLSGASEKSALVAGAAFGFGQMLTSVVLEQATCNTASWAGFSAAAAIHLGRRPSMKRGGLLALCIGAAWLAGKPEAALWQATVDFVLAIVSAGRVRRAQLRAALATVSSVIWGSLLAAAVVLPALDFARSSTRMTKKVAADALDWSASLHDLASSFVMGANWPIDDYWGDQQMVPTLFLGTLVVAAAIINATGRAGRRRALPILLWALALGLLSMGRNFPPAALLLRLWPLNLFRFPAKYCVGFCFLLCLLSARGFDRVAAFARRRGVMPRATRLSLVGALLLGPLLALGSQRIGMKAGAVPGLMMALLFLVAAAVIVFGIPAAKQRRGAVVLTAICGLAGLEIFTSHLLSAPPIFVSAAKLSAPSRLAASLGRAGWARLSFGEGLISEFGAAFKATTDPLFTEHYIEHSRDAMVPLRFVEERLPAVDGYSAPEPPRIYEEIEAGTRGFFDLAGVGFYLRRHEAPFADLTELPIADDSGQADPVLRLPRVYRSATALPHAFVVHRARAASDEEARAFLREGKELRELALLDLPAGASLPKLTECQGSSAQVTALHANSLSLAVDACADGLLLVTDAFMSGWIADVDGARSPLFRADYLVRGVPVSAGHHLVELRYRPTSFALGVGISVFCALLLAVAWIRPRREALP